METFFALVIVGGIVALVVSRKRKKRRAIETLKTAYLEALEGTDKQKAVFAGRAYYRALKLNGENAIANDIATMKV